MSFNSWLHYFSPEQLVDIKNLKTFLLDNNIIATTAGVLIAYSAWDFIQSFVGDLILPGVYFLFIVRFVSNKFFSSVFEPVNRLNLPRFITRLISFVVVITFTFLFIQYIIKNWLNDKTDGSKPVAPTTQGNVVIQSTGYSTNVLDTKGDMQYSSFTINPI
jgi:large-conductance mechanosensitive channel